MSSAKELLRAKLASTQKRVEHPLARYSASGVLSCALCRKPVKSDALWKAHLLSKNHRELLGLQKKGSSTPAASTAQAAPAPTAASKVRDTQGFAVPGGRMSAAAAPARKRPASDGDGEGDGDSAGSAAAAAATTSAAKRARVDPTAANAPAAPSGLPAGFFDSAPAAADMVETTAPAEDEDDGAEESAEAAEDTAAASVDANGLPLGFFDTPQQEVTEVDHSRDISPAEKKQASLEEEWATFEKEIGAASKESDAMIAQDLQQDLEERRRRQAFEQEQMRIRAERIKDTFSKKASQLKSTQGGRRAAPASNDNDDDDDDDDDDDVDLDDLSGWRSKGI